MILNGNGRETGTQNGITEPQIHFPVTYIMKVIVDIKLSDGYPDVPVREILENLNIDYKWISEKKSGKNNFLSYSIELTLPNRESMQRLYEGLKTIKSIKLAI